MGWFLGGVGLTQCDHLSCSLTHKVEKWSAHCQSETFVQTAANALEDHLQVERLLFDVLWGHADGTFDSATAFVANDQNHLHSQILHSKLNAACSDVVDFLSVQTWGSFPRLGKNL